MVHRPCRRSGSKGRREDCVGGVACAWDRGRRGKRGRWPLVQRAAITAVQRDRCRTLISPSLLLLAVELVWEPRRSMWKVVVLSLARPSGRIHADCSHYYWSLEVVVTQHYAIDRPLYNAITGNIYLDQLAFSVLRVEPIRSWEDASRHRLGISPVSLPPWGVVLYNPSGRVMVGVLWTLISKTTVVVKSRIPLLAVDLDCRSTNRRI